MYSLLIVDDEIYAAKALEKGIDWYRMGFKDVYTAYDAEDAMEILAERDIDILICDIEMPRISGIELLKWLNDNYLEIYTIFLTGHALFDYAQEAIKYGCYDYILKPIDCDLLVEVVNNILSEICERNKKEEFYLIYKKYYGLWKKNLPVLKERFWQDIISLRIINQREVKNYLKLYDISFELGNRLLPVLISIEEWKEILDNEDEEIIKYAIKNIANEIILEEFNGIVIQNHEGNILVLIYLDEKQGIDIEELKNTCFKFINEINYYLKSKLSCYVGRAVNIGDISKSYHSLLELERNNIARSNTVICKNEEKKESRDVPIPPSFDVWLELFEMCEKDKLLAEINNYLKQLNNTGYLTEALEYFYFGLLHITYHVIHKKGFSLKEVYKEGKMISFKDNIRSLNQLKKWAFSLLTQGIDFLQDNNRDNSANIDRVMEYIDKNYKGKITRQKIAENVYLNPAYLSRLFKKETGAALSEYILKLKVKEAKRLLCETNKNISAIAEEVGYYNYSHFSKMFKKTVGVTPHIYRQNYQDV